MHIRKTIYQIGFIAGLLLLPAVAIAQTNDATGTDTSMDAVLRRIEQLEQELSDIKAELKETRKQSEQTASEAGTAVQKADAAAKQAEAAAREARSAAKETKGDREKSAKWHLAGYADAGLMISNQETDTFVIGSFNPGFHFQYNDIVMFEAELEFEFDRDGETETELEYAQFDIFLHDNATLVVGKYLSPIGQFQERLHPSWINKMVDAPAGFGHDGVQPASEVGVQLRGGIPIGETTFTYALAVGNGPRVGHEGGVELEGFVEDDNGNKSVGGRIGFLPLPYFEIGASFLTTAVTGIEGTGGPEPTTADFNLWGADMAFTRGPWDIRFEYLNAERDSIFTAEHDDEEVEFLPELKLEAWYAQIAYQLSGITEQPVLRNFEPAIRYGEFKIDGLEELEKEAAEKRLNIGLNYWLTPSVVARMGVEWRNFKAEEVADETIYEFQFSYGF